MVAVYPKEKITKTLVSYSFIPPKDKTVAKTDYPIECPLCGGKMERYEILTDKITGFYTYKCKKCGAFLIYNDKI